MDRTETDEQEVNRAGEGRRDGEGSRPDAVSGAGEQTGPKTALRSEKTGVPWLRILPAALILGTALVVGWFADVPAQVRTALDWIDGLGWWAPAAFVLIYILIAVLLIPGSILTIGAGAVFGVIRGTIYTSIGSTLGATAAFLLGRFLLRGWVTRILDQRPRLKAVDEAVGREGARIIFLLRLSPLVPYSVSNYVYGLTNIRTLPYMLASWIGMIPGTLLYAYIGSLVQRVADLGQAEQTATTGEWALYALGLIATAIVTVRITRIATRAVRGKLDIGEEDESSTTRDAEQPGG